MEVSFQTGSLLKSSWLSLPLGLRRLFFPKIDMSGFFGHVHFGKKCVSAQIWSKHPPRYSKILSGSLQEALQRHSEVTSEAICVSNALGQSWKAFCAKTIVFFCQSGATDLKRRRVAKATCTKYRACAQKLSAVFRSLATSGARPELPRPSEPRQINLFGE